MPKIKAAFFEIEDWEKKYLAARLPGLDLQFFKEPANPANLKSAAGAKIISVFIYSPITGQALESLPGLKYIATRSTGFDHIDLPACRKRGISVSNVPVYGENTVAEHAFALILALSRKIVHSSEKVKRGDFDVDDSVGMDLLGKTIGVIGAGNIGQHVIRMAKGFGMSVLVFDPRRRPELAAQLGFKYATLPALLKRSDIVTIHAPYNKQTHHLINAKSLKLFKRGAYLINTARGAICDTAALLRGLKNSTFAGLGLDVLEEECFIREEKELLSAAFKKDCNLKIALENHILINQPNVIITPHNAFNSREALTRILDTTIDNIKSAAKGKIINGVGIDKAKK